MYYLGGKNRIAKHIIPITLSGWGDRYKMYIEPFAGGCGMIQRVPLLDGCTVVGYDKNPYLIALLNYGKTVLNSEDVLNYERTHWSDDLFTTDITKEEYKMLRSVAKMSRNERLGMGISDELMGWAGFIYSYRGDFFQGYCGSGADAMKESHSYIKTIQAMKGKYVECKSYHELVLPDQPCIIYCDPPYINERYVGKCFNAHWLEIMDYELLYDTMRYWRSLGHAVYLSERTAPTDFVPIWAKDVEITMTKGADNKNVGLGDYVKEDRRKTEFLFTLI